MIVVAVVVTFVLLLASGRADAAVVAGEAVGTLRFGDAEGRKVALDAPGVLYVIDFWALGCKPCLAEMPDLNRLAREYEAGGKVRFIGVVYGDWKRKELPKIAQAVGTTLPVYNDPEDWYERLGIESFPTKLFLRDGVVLRVRRGGGAGSYEHLRALIESEIDPTALE